MTIFIIILFMFIWFISLFLLSYWKYFYKFLLINAIIVILYYVIIVYGKNYFWGSDPYGLGMFLRLVLTVICHTIIIFIFSIYKSFQLRNNEKST